MLKLTVVLTVALALSSATPHRQGLGQTLKGGDRVRDLLTAVVDFVHAQISKHGDPIHPSDYEVNSITDYFDGLMRANFTAADAVVSGFSTALAEDIKTHSDPMLMTGRINLRFPEITWAGRYSIEGELAGHNVKGNGHFKLQVVNLTFSLNNIQLLEIKNKALRINSVGMAVDVLHTPVEVDGLEVEDMAESDFEEYLSLTLSTLIKTFIGSIAPRAEAFYIESLNTAIGDRTLEDVIQWLKDHKDFQPESAHLQEFLKL